MVFINSRPDLRICISCACLFYTLPCPSRYFLPEGPRLTPVDTEQHAYVHVKLTSRQHVSYDSLYCHQVPEEGSGTRGENRLFPVDQDVHMLSRGSGTRKQRYTPTLTDWRILILCLITIKMCCAPNSTDSRCLWTRYSCSSVLLHIFGAVMLHWNATMGYFCNQWRWQRRLFQLSVPAKPSIPYWTILCHFITDHRIFSAGKQRIIHISGRPLLLNAGLLMLFAFFLYKSL